MAKSGDGNGIPVGFGDVTASVGDHIAHFYRGEGEMFGVLGPYIAEATRRGDKCAVVSSPDAADQLRGWLASNGIDAAGARETGQLVLHPGEATVADMRAMFERIEASALKDGYKFVRLAGDGGWALDQVSCSCELACTPGCMLQMPGYGMLGPSRGRVARNRRASGGPAYRAALARPRRIPGR